MVSPEGDFVVLSKRLCIAISVTFVTKVADGRDQKCRRA